MLWNYNDCLSTTTYYLHLYLFLPAYSLNSRQFELGGRFTTSVFSPQDISILHSPYTIIQYKVRVSLGIGFLGSIWHSKTYFRTVKSQPLNAGTDKKPIVVVLPLLCVCVLLSVVSNHEDSNL
jgi:hypothetical protein